MPAKSILLPVMSAVMPKALKPTLISGNAHPHAITAVRANTTTHTGRWNMDVFLINFLKVGAKLAKILRLSLNLSSDLIVFVIGSAG
jgi:hypothetical protein